MASELIKMQMGAGTGVEPGGIVQGPGLDPQLC